MFGTSDRKISLWFIFSAWLFTLRNAMAEKCNEELGMRTKGIPDERIQASTNLSDNHLPSFARLDNFKAWCPDPSDKLPYLQITFEEEKMMTAITTQGSRGDGRWAQKFEIKYMNHIGIWVPYGKVLEGNTNIAARNEILLRPSIVTRSVQIYPKDPQALFFNPAIGDIPCLRLELYGCSAPAPCPDPGLPSNGKRDGSDFGHDQTVTFQCNDNYTLVGNERMSCNDGVWSAELPQCKAPCADPGLPSNGKRDSSNFGHEKTVIFQCNDNYTLVGNERMSCNDGVWSAELPQCKAPCADPGLPSNGKRDGSDFGHEKTVTFQCNDKYSLVGDESMSCNDGVWSADLPQCKAPCTDPGLPSNGKRDSSDFGHDKTVTFQCNDNYTLVGNERMSCNDGVWSAELPQCKAPCADPGLPSNGKRDSSNFGHEKTVIFQCNDNYTLVGNERMSCNDGVWSAELPQCKAPCADPGLPSNGKRDGSDFGHEKTVTFQCNDKYSLVGDESMSCNDGVWSADLPQCKAPCTDPGLPSNGKRDSSDFGHDKTVTFQCNDNYTLVGNERMSCNDGVWSAELPQCKAPCADPGLPSNGKRDGSDFGHEKTVTFQCNDKYSLVGDESMSCNDGVWSAELPQCKAPCADPGLPSNGKRDGSDFGHEKTVTFQCNDKYSLVGDKNLSCNDGVWSAELPQCKAPCTDPGLPSNGKRDSSDFGHDKTVTFQCNDNYTLVGNERMSCNDGVWSAELPQCKAPCADPGLPSNGKRDSSNFGHEKTVIFQCNDNYTLVGNERMSCNDGVWSAELPQCKAPCADPGLPSNGKRDGSDFGHEKTVTFQCNDKYSLVGDESMSCNDGVWSADLPQCKAPCADPGLPSNGKRDGSDFGHEKTVTFQCNDKYSLVGDESMNCNDGVWSAELPQCKAPCADPGLPSNGKRDGSDFGHERTVTFQCNDKYSLVGDESMSCNDGVWSAELPQCKAPCTDPGLPSNSKRDGSDFGHDKTVTFQCNDNYTLVGNERMSCNDGVWSAELPQCKAPCADPGLPSNGKRDSSNFGHEKTVIFQCNDNYTLVGNERMSCNDGVWSAELPQCKAPCADPGLPSNGRRDGSDFSHGRTVTFQCNDKYSLVGDESMSCNDGVWSAELPQCKAPCADPGLPSNGRRDGSDFSHGRTVTFQCNDKYSLVGDESMSCNDGVWSAESPQCKAPCADPGLPSNGKRDGSDFGHDKAVTFQCNDKYSLVGDKNLSCNDGVWSAELPQCKAPCADPGLPSNGKRDSSNFGHEKTVKFQCNDNYTLVGNERMSCNDGVWSAELPQCKAPCADPGLPSNGKRDSSNFGHDKTVIFQCNDNYTLVGNERMSCNDGVWSAELPQCKAPCADPGLPSNGRRDGSDFSHGRTVTFQCNDKYSLVGDESMSCNDGVWSAELPQCKAPCADPGLPSNGRRDGSDFGHGRTVTFQCNDKYSLVGDESMSCNDGVWSAELPQCKAPCADPGLPSNGRRDGSDFGHGRTVTFQCNDKYSLVGDESMSCNDGVWSAELPQCKAPCTDPGLPSNGKREGSDFGHDKTVTFQCNDNYTLVGNERMSCNDGVWSAELPQCKAPCADPGLPSNGKRDSSNFGHEKTVIFQCNDNYTLVGNERMSCNDGVWSAELPQCKAPCTDPGLPSNGKRDGSDFGHDQTVTFQCNDNYTLVGNERMSCNDGVWSAELPQCKAPCADPGLPSNGKRDGSDFGHDKTVTFQCNDKYSLVGNERMRCNDGVWSANLPQCKANCHRNNSDVDRNCIKTCLSDDDCPANWKCLCDGDCGLSCVKNNLKCKRHPRGPKLKFLNNGRLFGSMVTYLCQEPYILHGSPKRTCRANGKWDGKRARCSLGDAKCAKILLGLLQNPPDNTTVTINAHLSMARYHCHKGFMLEGNNTRFCRNGRWLESTVPSCKASSLRYTACGESPVDFRARIIGGNESQRGWWPWHVGLYIRSGGKLNLQCGGALISSQWVLTTAECVTSHLLPDETINPLNYEIRAGDHRLDTMENTQQTISAEKIVYHQAFDPDTYMNDIALIKLQKPAELNKFVRAVCLPSQDGGDLAIPGKYGYATGWGYTKAREVSYSNTLQYSSFTIQSNSVCRYSTSYPYFSRVMFCAGDGGGKKGSCYGDAGGAFVREEKRGDGYRWVVTGIDSWGEACVQRNKYGYYTRVYSYINWINKTVREN
ncbi:sushi, von Willebrand factor type A, EGF and pentraxin domain-containing protein 1-like isoform X5 [Acropora millepora]|uniref:sushi, von Willebrand factor type A, EGF and pentraxin domain-containing protein 1-like isoform X5 n=1 Tax=Acropora millepora TaxID=45264 RepID=UPI001CF2D1E9|nr:sushi, von Willebrand factor type A, EGF and pentraxin domain-containing protein 1-like isoform X5 [Acropora millepora]